MISTTQAAESVARTMLVGRYLDHYIVTSNVIVLVMLQIPRIENQPPTVWLQFLCDARVDDGGSEFYSSSDPTTRSMLVSRFHRLLGKEVKGVFLSPENVLSVQLDSSSFALVPTCDGSTLEWQIASEYPDLMTEARWLVALDGEGDLITRT